MYESGRTVKGSKKISPIAKATAEARRIVAPLVNCAHIISKGSADPKTLAPQIRTVITFPTPRDAEVIAEALAALDRVVRIIADPNGVTIIREA